MSKKFKDDRFVSIVNDIQKIQQRPEMYVGSGDVGCQQMAIEDISNHIDECSNPDSPGSNIDIEYNDGEIKSSDDGRGLPIEVMESALTVLNTSTKFYRENGASAGENGCGFKAVTALSDYCTVISYRPNEVARMDFKLGKYDPMKITKNKEGNTGLAVKFKPSEIFMGKGCGIDVNRFETWLRNVSYLIDPEITMNYKRKANGKTVFKTKYKNIGGLISFINNEMKFDGEVEKVSKPVVLNASKNIQEEVIARLDDPERGIKQGDVMYLDRAFKLAIAFSYNISLEYLEYSFCNFINTTERGSHIDGAKAGLVKFFKEETSKLINLKDKDLTIQDRDVEQGLSLCINVVTDLNPRFVGQIKGRVGNGEFFKLCRDMTYESLRAYFKDNPSELKTICSYIKTNAKSRVAGLKARKSVIKENKDQLVSNLTNKNLVPANNTGKYDYRELYIVEGDSAVPDKYDNYSQAIFKLRGYSTNCMNVELSELLDPKKGSKEVINLITALKCNVGTKFDITRLYYDKIIIMTDSDADGYVITTLVLTLFVKYLPELILAGKVYKCIAPLYKLKNSKRQFIHERAEFIIEFESNLIGNIKLFKENDKEIKGDKFTDFLYINKEYTIVLKRVANHLTMNEDLCEYLAYQIALGASDKQIKRAVEKKFKEISIDDNVLVGTVDYKYQICNLDDIFIYNIKPLVDLIKGNKTRLYYRLDEKEGRGYVNRGVYTIGQLMKYLERKYSPEIVERYKGLGELNPQELVNYALNPNNRILYRFTADDMDKVLEEYEILHGDTAKGREMRKKIFTNMEIDQDIFDN